MKFLGYLSSLRFFPYIFTFYFSRHKDLLSYERDVWLNHWKIQKRGLRGLLLLLNCYPEYRSLIMFRTGHHWLSLFARGQNNLEFYMPSEKVGKGLMIWHGFSTVINSDYIGEGFQVWQNVTIGHGKSTLHSKSLSDRPSFGNDVKVMAGAMVVGGIHIGDKDRKSVV